MQSIRTAATSPLPRRSQAPSPFGLGPESPYSTRGLESPFDTEPTPLLGRPGIGRRLTSRGAVPQNATPRTTSYYSPTEPKHPAIEKVKPQRIPSPPITSSNPWPHRQQPAPPPPPPPAPSRWWARAPRPRLTWWWFELCASALSLLSVALLVVLLARIDGTPAAAWRLGLTPGATIAVCATAARSGMLAAVAGCLGQLRWRHFSAAARPLGRLRALDEAGRGPWGALRALAAVRDAPVVGLAVVTLVALALDPAAQQMLKQESRPGPLGGAAVGTVPRAGSYVSRAFDRLTPCDSDTGCPPPGQSEALVQLQTAVISGAVIGANPQSNFSCPESGSGTRCQWPDFSTLGVCGLFQNVTSKITKDCSSGAAPGNEQYKDCRYNFTQAHSSLGVVAPTDCQTIGMSWTSTSIGLGQGSSNNSLVGAVGFTSNTTASGEVATLDVVRVTDEDTLATEAYVLQWFWCEQSFSGVAATPARLQTTNRTDTRLQLARYAQLAGQRNFLVYQRASNGTDNLSDDAKSYNVSYASAHSLFTYITGAFGQPLTDTASTSVLSLGQFLYTADLPAFAQAMGDTLTNLVRGGDNLVDEGGEGSVNGTVRNAEPYFVVRWGWLAVPLIEVVLAAVLLGLTIRLTRGMPLFKNSVMAYLVCRLEGWSEPELVRMQGLIRGPDAAARLEDVAEEMRARFGEDKTGRMGFIRS